MKIGAVCQRRRSLLFVQTLNKAEEKLHTFITERDVCRRRWPLASHQFQRPNNPPRDHKSIAGFLTHQRDNRQGKPPTEGSKQEKCGQYDKALETRTTKAEPTGQLRGRPVRSKQATASHDYRFFIPELNNHDVQELWFQQDGATCHTARATIDLLKDTFGDRLISRFGPVNWPPRSCDLTPLDYFLWGYVKSLVYVDKPQTLDHLEDNIRRVIADIRPQMLEKVIENWTSRLDYIRASHDSHIPEIIFKIGVACRSLRIKIALTGPCFVETIVLGAVSAGTECETILFPMRNGRDLERCERVLFERFRKTEWEMNGEESDNKKKLVKFWQTD
ncbi:transposable element Tc3 transposase [Trichonephila clavipes]|nr:transposable element Tc3 transposase [Trichonephila clavipes]